MEKATRTDPKRAMAIPTEQMRTYFQVASREAAERWVLIKGALARVVASMAIHITMIWSDRVTMVMVDKNTSMAPVKRLSDWISLSLRKPTV